MPSVTIENFEAKLATIVGSVESSEHAEKIVEYIHERRANGIRVTTLNANAGVLRSFANFLGKPFLDAMRTDLNAYVNNRTGQRVYRSFDVAGNMTEVSRSCTKSDSTMDHHKVVLRGFYKWLHGGEEYPDCVKHLKTRTGRKKTISTDRLISRDELAAMLQAAGEVRLKALVAFMWESGLRAGEVVALNVGSLDFDELGCKVTIPSNAQGLKTGARTVRALSNESAPFLHEWFEQHPLSGNPDAPLFFGSSRRNPRGRMLPSSLYALVQRVVGDAGIKRHIKPHDFRHTAATEKARLGYNEAHLRHYFGWSRTSDMPSNYVHLAGADFDAMMMEKHGIVVQGPEARQVMHAPCSICGKVNAVSQRFCKQCRRPTKPGVDVESNRDESVVNFVREMVLEQLERLQKQA